MAGVCNVHGCPADVHRLGRCREHAGRYDSDQRRTVPTKETRSRAEQERRSAAIRHHVAIHGWTCPGDDSHVSHPCTDLTAHHVDAVALGGNPHGELAVLCRSRNSAIGARTS